MEATSKAVQTTGCSEGLLRPKRQFDQWRAGRLSSGRFAWWPDGEQPGCTLQACELQVLLMGGDPSRAHTAPAWRASSLAA